MKKETINDFRVSLIETLKNERKIRNLSHEKISLRAGVTRQTIGKIESGGVNPTMVTMLKIVSAMNMDLSDFVQNMEFFMAQTADERSEL